MAQYKNIHNIFFDLVLQVEKDHDPMAQYKKPTIADREDEYRARRMAQVLSPDRVDPFMDGELIFFFALLNFNIKVCMHL